MQLKADVIILQAWTMMAYPIYAPIRIYMAARRLNILKIL
jgi:hypothetical protein